METTIWIIAILILIFGLQLTINGFTDLFIFDPLRLEPWRFLSSMFLHADLMHLFFNCFTLFLFGPYLENVLGRNKFILFFILSGLVGSLLYYLTIAIGIIPPTKALGASGAIFGILGALSVLMPNMLILLFGFIPLRMREAAILWIVLEFLNSFDYTSGIGSAAHLGGLLFGIIAIRFFVRERNYERW
ncbi:MAG: rhomboid family intramembrane serine protease [Candidatus Micrarchaeota archaeon]|nr:rhomboid family intramembrane serine protease [Candidatus Micrarchaeota archaeon]